MTGSYDVETLRQDWAAGGCHKFLFFWKPEAEADGSLGPGCLGQWWPSRFTIGGVEYCCAEQWMMAEKARMFGDEEMLAAILGTKSPKEMKAYGRAVRNFQQEVWEARCYGLVLEGNIAKFSQNPELKEYLLSTKRRILVEASPFDRIWGIGMGKNNPNAENPMKWRGRNLLGFALTEARDRLTLGPADGGSGGGTGFCRRGV